MQEQMRGWKSMRFTFGASLVDGDDTPDQPIEASPYDQEVLDYGCYRATVDFDRLDQQ